MIVDTSALICIHQGEADAAKFIDALINTRVKRISAGSLLETYLIADSHQPRRVSGRLDRLIADIDVEIVPVDQEQVLLARAAYRDYGKGSGHPAGLNFGDCFAYALARRMHEPLLFKGDDFGHTDIEAALTP